MLLPLDLLAALFLPFQLVLCLFPRTSTRLPILPASSQTHIRNLFYAKLLFANYYFPSVPGFDSSLRYKLVQFLEEIKIPNLVTEGSYAQTLGPRFETPAEIKALAVLGNSVVGMTCADEAILCKEMGLPYAVVCIVDNMANGVIADKLTFESFKEAVRSNKMLVEKIAVGVVDKFSVYSKSTDSRIPVDLMVFAKYVVPVVPEAVLHDHCVVVTQGKIVDVVEQVEAENKYFAVEKVNLPHVKLDLKIF